MKTEKCPYHDIEPMYFLRVFREKAEKTWFDRDGNDHIMILPRLADHYFYCPKCRNIINNTSLINLSSSDRANMSKLAMGYYSSKSESVALANWNKAISNMIVKIFKKSVAGK